MRRWPRRAARRIGAAAASDRCGAAGPTSPRRRHRVRGCGVGGGAAATAPAPCAVPSLGCSSASASSRRLRQASVAWSGCPPSVRAAWRYLPESMRPIECACCLRVMDAHLAPTLARARGRRAREPLAQWRDPVPDDCRRDAHARARRRVRKGWRRAGAPPPPRALVAGQARRRPQPPRPYAPRVDPVGFAASVGEAGELAWLPWRRRRRSLRRSGQRSRNSLADTTSRGRRAGGGGQRWTSLGALAKPPTFGLLAEAKGKHVTVWYEEMANRPLPRPRVPYTGVVLGIPTSTASRLIRRGSRRQARAHPHQQRGRLGVGQEADQAATWTWDPSRRSPRSGKERTLACSSSLMC